MRLNLLALGFLGLALLAPAPALAHGEGILILALALPSMVVPGLFLGWLSLSWIRGARLPRISTAVAVFATSLATYMFNFTLARSDVGSGPAAQVWMNFLWWAVPVALPAAAWAAVDRWNRRRASRS